MMRYQNVKEGMPVTRKHGRTMAGFDLRQPWVLSLMMMACIPLFPEYIAPFLAVFALLFAKSDAKRHHRRVRVGASGKVIIAFLLLMTVHWLWASERLIGAVTIAFWWAMLLVYLALSTVLVSRRRIETALFTLSLIVGLLGLLACVQYVCVAVLHMKEVPLQLWEAVDSKVFSLVGMPFTMQWLGTRAASTFTNPNLYAQFTVMALPFMAAYSFSGKRSAAKIISRLALLLAIGGIFVSFSRGAYLAVGAIVVVLCIANIRRLIPISMVAFSAVLLLPETIYDRLFSMGNANDVAITERLGVWGITMATFFERPIFGHGLGVGTIWPRLNESGYSAPHAHNLFLEFLVEGGLVGLIFLLFLMWRLFRQGFELVIHAPKTRMYGAAIIAFVAGLCVCGMVDLPLFTPKTISIFMIALALTDALSFVEMKHSPLTFSQSLPLLTPLRAKLEAWVRRKTAPKSESEQSNQNHH